MIPFSKYLKEEIQDELDVIDTSTASSDCNFPNISIDDQLLLSSARIYAYDVGMQTVDDKNKTIPINPKKFPKRAVCLKIPVEDGECQIFLATKHPAWLSKCIINGEVSCLSAEQMKQFFRTKAYYAIAKKLKNNWPLTDEKYNKLYQVIAENIPNEDEETSNECDGLVSTSPGAMTTGDVLGNDCDHSGGSFGGFFGKGCNHIPKPIFKQPMRRTDIEKKKKKKTFLDEEN